MISRFYKKPYKNDNDVKMAAPLLIILLIFANLSLSGASAAGEAQAIRRGNKLYDAGRFKEAFQVYEGVINKRPDSEILNFNAAGILYRLENYKKARQLFLKASLSENKDFEAKASYNIGNSLFKEAALEANTDMNSAINLLKDALQYYQRSIELNPKDEDAKFNYELTKKELQSKQEQHAEEDKSRQEKKSGSQQEEKKSGQGAASGQEPQKEGAQDRGEEYQEGEPPDYINAESQKEQTGRMSEEEARMLVGSFSKEGVRLDFRDIHRDSTEADVQKGW